MNINTILSDLVFTAIKELWSTEFDKNLIQLQSTKREFNGDITVVVFPVLRFSKKKPEETAHELGNYIQENCKYVLGFNVIKGFLNIEISNEYYLDFLNSNFKNKEFAIKSSDKNSKVYMVEYSSPNTNKPLHLGHIRNNLLGFSISKILEATGKKVIKTNIVNDRGIHICKSMLSWQKWGHGITPENAGIKGDKLVGEYYVKFDTEYKKQKQELIKEGKTEEEATKNAPLIIEAQEMLRKWENKDPEIYKLWQTMNQWVYDGFDMTYERLGVAFDEIYYESDTYLVGREIVLKGLENNIFYKRDDNSVWADLTNEGLDEKVLLRADGTSVYMTQDVGTAQLRQKDYNPDKMIYVVGNEQNYHFKVLAIILDKLGFAWAKDLYHMSYGMVELPEGKMKSREGTVVDADDLIDEMISTAHEMSLDLGKLNGLDEAEKNNICRIIGLGALKYFILKVDPIKNMTFDPKESIDFNGNTGPFIQYTYTRIRSVFRKAREDKIDIPVQINKNTAIAEKEKSLLKLLHDYSLVLKNAAEGYNPSLLANYAYELAKEYNQFYHDYTILKEPDEKKRDIRLALSQMVSNVIYSSMNLLSIEMPERM